MASGISENTGALMLMLVIIILLSIYVIYLNIKLINNKMVLRNIIRIITGENKNPDRQEIHRLISELLRLNIRSYIHDSKIFEDRTLSFILENEHERKIYLHYTMLEEDARNIMLEGFRYVETFYRTAIPVTSDKLDLLMKHNDRRLYGDFVIVICISSDLVEDYIRIIEGSGLKNYSFENLITEIPPEVNENSDPVFVLPRQFIKGYFNHKTGEIHSNNLFNPGYISPEFIKNAENLTRLDNISQKKRN